MLFRFFLRKASGIVFVLNLCVFLFLKYSLDAVFPSRLSTGDASAKERAETLVPNYEPPKKFPGKAVHPVTIPSMNGTRGVIFFYHLQKTGGITIRKAMMRNTKARVQYVRIPPQWKAFLTQSDHIHQYLLKNLNGSRILFVEYHGGKESTLNMTPHFEKWREASQTTQVPLFVFTLLREPVAHAISHFNFFHVAPGAFPFNHELYDPTEENLKALATSEHQLRMLAHGGEGRSMLHVDLDDEWEQAVRNVL